MYECQTTEVIAEITPKDTVHFIKRNTKNDFSQVTWDGMIIIKNTRKFKLLYKIRTNNPNNYYIEDSYKLLEKYETHKIVINYIGPEPNSDLPGDRIKVNYNELKDYKKTSENLQDKDKLRDEWNSNKSWYENQNYSTEFVCQFPRQGSGQENHFKNKRNDSLCINNLSIETLNKHQVKAMVNIPYFQEGSQRDTRPRIFESNYNKTNSKQISFDNTLNNTLETLIQNVDLEKMRDDNITCMDNKSQQIILQNKSIALNSHSRNSNRVSSKYGKFTSGAGSCDLNQDGNTEHSQKGKLDISHKGYHQRVSTNNELEDMLEISTQNEIGIDEDLEVNLDENYTPNDQFINIDNYLRTRKEHVMAEKSKKEGQTNIGPIQHNNQNILATESTFRKKNYAHNIATSERFITEHDAQQNTNRNNFYMNRVNTESVEEISKQKVLAKQISFKDDRLKTLDHEVRQLKQDLAREVFIQRNIRIDSKNKSNEQEISDNKTKNFYDENNGQIIIIIVGLLLGMFIAH